MWGCDGWSVGQPLSGLNYVKSYTLFGYLLELDDYGDFVVSSTKEPKWMFLAEERKQAERDSSIAEPRKQKK